MECMVPQAVVSHGAISTAVVRNNFGEKKNTSQFES